MSIIQSSHNSNSKESKSNQKYNEELVNILNTRIKQFSQGGRSDLVKQHQDRGKLLVRDRIQELIDADTPF